MMFSLGDFKSSSGTVLPWKIECDSLGSEDWDCIASIVVNQFGVQFGDVEGVPRGGLPFAKALRPYITEGPLLIVDDVLTTGASMEAQRASRPALGFVLFARREPSPWIQPIFRTTF